MAAQLQPPLHRQLLLHLQGSPQEHRSTTARAQPHEAFSHRHCV